MPTSPDWLIDEILPAREIHLVAGPTGAGKTRWLFETLLEWEQSHPVLGKESHACPWVYVASDRTYEGTCRTMRDLGIDPAHINTIKAWDEKLELTQIFERAKEYQLLVIESFGGFCTNANSNQVAAFLRSVSCIIQARNQTVIGVVEQPKMKPGDRYRNPRQRVSGPAGWGHHAETIFLVEHLKEDAPDDPRRKLFVCPRNSRPSLHHATLADGHFRIVK